MLIEVFKSLSRRIGVYNTIRYSKIYYRILKYKNPGYIRALDEDLAFYRRLLGDSLGLIFDVGANHGDKTWAFRQLAKRVVSIEPDGPALRHYARDTGGIGVFAWRMLPWETGLASGRSSWKRTDRPTTR